MIVNLPKLIFAFNYTINSLVFLIVRKIYYIYITIYRIENNEPELNYPVEINHSRFFSLSFLTFSNVEQA